MRKLLRLAGTGVAFSLFGLGALILSFLVFPLLSFSCRDQFHSILRVRLFIHYACRFFCRVMELLGLLSIEIQNPELLDEASPSLILANHPTLIDILLILSQHKTASCVVKKAMKNNFFLRRIVTQACYVYNETAQELIDSCAAALLEGNSLVIFPEGTRSPAVGLRRFQRGAAEVVLRTGVPIVAVLIECSPPTLGKDTPWYRVPPKPPRITCRVLGPLKASEIVGESCQSWIFRRKLTSFLQDFFEAEVGNG